VTGLDEQLQQSLHNLAAGIGTDPEDLAVVHRRARVARRRARGTAALGVLAVAGLATAAIVALGKSHHPSNEEPAGPTPTAPSQTPLSSLPNPFTVVRTINAAAVGIHQPLKVAAAPNGDVYVTDRHQHVTELDHRGDVVRRWGGPGTGPGEFRLYSGAITVGPNGRVYVADTGNFRIQVFSSTGRFLAQYGGYGLGSAKFVWPSDVVVGNGGTMYVADDRAATITALSPDGRQLWRRGTTGETDPDLIGHEHLGGVDPQGRVVTANDDTGKVLFLGPQGQVVDSFSTNDAGAGLDASTIPGGHFPHGTCGATFDSRGDVYVASCEESYARQHDTAVYDSEHRLVAGWPRGDLADSPVFGPDGHGWAVTSGNRSLVELAVHLPTG
jgi:hypothetical protein